VTLGSFEAMHTIRLRSLGWRQSRRYAPWLAVVSIFLGCLDARVSSAPEARPASVRVEPTSTCLVSGGVLSLTATLQDVQGHALPTPQVFWSTSDSGVVTVSPTGLVTARAPGTAEVAAEVGGFSAQTSLRVSQGQVTFVIDDGHETDYTIKKPIFDVKGAVAVVAIISTQRYLTDQELHAFLEDGWEVAAHSRTHVPEDTLTPAQLEREIGGAQADLAARGFMTSVHVYPYGAHSPLSDSVAKEHFEAALLAGGGPNPLPIRDWYAVRRKNFGARYALPGQNTPSFYQALVDTTRVDGRWLVFMIHELTGADSTHLSDLLDYIHQSGLPIVTFSEGVTRTQDLPPEGCLPAYLSN